MNDASTYTDIYHRLTQNDMKILDDIKTTVNTIQKNNNQMAANIFMHLWTTVDLMHTRPLICLYISYNRLVLDRNTLDTNKIDMHMFHNNLNASRLVIADYYRTTTNRFSSVSAAIAGIDNLPDIRMMIAALSSHYLSNIFSDLVLAQTLHAYPSLCMWSLSLDSAPTLQIWFRNQKILVRSNATGLTHKTTRVAVLDDTSCAGISTNPERIILPIRLGPLHSCRSQLHTLVELVKRSYLSRIPMPGVLRNVTVGVIQQLSDPKQATSLIAMHTILLIMYLTISFAMHNFKIQGVSDTVQVYILTIVSIINEARLPLTKQRMITILRPHYKSLLSFIRFGYDAVASAMYPNRSTYFISCNFAKSGNDADLLFGTPYVLDASDPIRLTGIPVFPPILHFPGTQLRSLRGIHLHCDHLVDDLCSTQSIACLRFPVHTIDMSGLPCCVAIVVCPMLRIIRSYARMRLPQKSHANPNPDTNTNDGGAQNATNNYDVVQCLNDMIMPLMLSMRTAQTSRVDLFTSTIDGDGKFEANWTKFLREVTPGTYRSGTCACTTSESIDVTRRNIFFTDMSELWKAFFNQAKLPPTPDVVISNTFNSAQASQDDANCFLCINTMSFGRNGCVLRVHIPRTLGDEHDALFRPIEQESTEYMAVKQYIDEWWQGMKAKCIRPTTHANVRSPPYEMKPQIQRIVRFLNVFQCDILMQTTDLGLIESDTHRYCVGTDTTDYLLIGKLLQEPELSKSDAMVVQLRGA